MICVWFISGHWTHTNAVDVSGNLILVASCSTFLRAVKVHVVIFWVDTVERSEFTQAVSFLTCVLENADSSLFQDATLTQVPVVNNFNFLRFIYEGESVYLFEFFVC